MSATDTMIAFLNGAPLAELGEGAEDAVRAELRVAITGCSLAIEQVTEMHAHLDAWVSARDQEQAQPSEEWARGFRDGRCYGAQRAQVIAGLLASAIVRASQ